MPAVTRRATPVRPSCGHTGPGPADLVEVEFGARRDLAWQRFQLPGGLALLLMDPACPGLASEVLAWFEDTASAAELAVTVLDAEKHLVGELVPVGTLPEFRRTGLARAVCLAALRAAHHAGAREAVVYPVINHPKSAGALPLYRALGFRPYARTLAFTRTRRRIPPFPGSASPEGAHKRT